MSVAVTNYKTTLTPNGVTTVFPLTFHAMTTDEISVFREVGDTSTEITSGFSISGVPGVGTVTFTTAPASGGVLNFYSDPNFQQGTVFSNQQRVNLDSAQDAIDELAVKTIYLKGKTEEARALAIDAKDGNIGPQGPKGDPGSGGGAVGLFSDIAGLTIPDGTDMVQVSGRAVVGDYAAGKSLMRVTDDVELDSDVLDLGGSRFRWSPGQVFCLEMFADDAETDALTAMRHMHDLCNYYGGGKCVGRPGAVYLFPNVRTTPSTFSTRTFTRADGKTCTYSFIGREAGEPRDPQLAGVAFYSFDGQGCTIKMDGNFNLTAADYQNGYRKRDTRIVWDIWKSANIVLKHLTWDGGWGDQTTDTGAAGECHSYAIRLTGVAGCEVERVTARNGAQDFIVTAHRNKAKLDNITLVSTEAYPEPDASTADVHDPAGICHSLVIRSCIIKNFRRQALSPVGCGYKNLAVKYPGVTVEDTIGMDVGRFPGAAPRWFNGDVTDGSVKYQWRGFPPRSFCDAEPVRLSGFQVTDITIRNSTIDGCIGSFAASTGSKGRARVEQSLDFTAVDVAANTFTKAALTLPRTRQDGIPAKIRVSSTGALPGGLAINTDYYLFKVSDTVFKLCASPADAIAGTAINITSQGSGTISFVWHDTPPNVGKIVFDTCTLWHPFDGSVQPMQVNCEHLRVTNCDIHIAAGTAYLGPNAIYDERQTWDGNRVTYVRAGLDVDNYAILKTQSLDGGAVDPTTETLTLAVDDGLGKFEYVPVKLRVSGSGAAMPTGLVQGRTYFMVRTGPLTRKFASTIANAKQGTYVNLETAGAGVLTYYRDIAQYDVKGNSFEHMPRQLEFDASAISTVTGRIPIPSMPFLREGVADGEHFEVAAVGAGTLPTGFVVARTYYSFMKYGDDSGVYLADTPTNAIAKVAIIPSAVGSGRCRLAPTVTTAQIDVLDANCRFTDNTVVIDMTEPVVSGTMVKIAGLFGLYGGNQFSTKGGSQLVPTILYARMTVDRADVLKGGFISTGP